MSELSRRLFLRQIGRGSLAIAIVGVAACADIADETTTEAPEQPPTDRPTTTAEPQSTIEPPTTSSVPTTEPPAAEEPGAWSRVNLGFVSAYVFVRRGEAALIDTGTSGSADAIASTLETLGLSYGDLSTVILTHHHGDHIGSLPDVMNMATSATAYAGAADIPNITSPRPVNSVADGDSVFGLDVIATPGHTPGHICILDASGVLVAGDALTGGNGGVDGPNPQFTPDMETANESVVKLAGFEFDVVYFGHGEPVTERADQAVTELAGSL